MTFTSSPGFSLMLEGISYLIGAQLPRRVRERDARRARARERRPRAGGPEARLPRPRPRRHARDRARAGDAAGDARLHDARLRALVPLPEPGRGPRRRLPRPDDRPGGAARPARPPRAPGAGRCRATPRTAGTSITSILLDPADFEEAHNRVLVEKYARMTAAEQRADAVPAATTPRWSSSPATRPRRIAKGAVATLRARGDRARASSARRRSGRSRSTALLPVLDRARRVVVVEASDGQLEDELRLALSHAGARPGLAIEHVRRLGGILPSQREIVEAVRAAAPRRRWRRERLLRAVRAARPGRRG